MNEFFPYNSLLALAFTLLITIRFYNTLTTAVDLSYQPVSSAILTIHR